jgi:hypothetical protein
MDHSHPNNATQAPDIVGVSTQRVEKFLVLDLVPMNDQWCAVPFQSV